MLTGDDTRDHTASTGMNISEEDKSALRKRAHECPVPRPGGFIGEVLGSKEAELGDQRPNTQIGTRAGTGEEERVQR